MTFSTFLNARFSIAKSVLFLLTPLLLACSRGTSNGSGQYSDKLSYRLDTVMVDAGDEILYVQGSLIYSDLDKDGKYLYNFNRNRHSIEKINLDQVQLEGMIAFEKEGPNAIDSYFSRFKISEEDEIVVCSNTRARIFDQQPQLIKEVDFNKVADNIIREESALLSNLLDYSSEKERFIGLFHNWQNSSYFILVVDNINNTHKRLNLQELDKLSVYDVEILYNGNFSGRFGSYIRALFHDDRILITNNVFNEVFVYDLTSDELNHKTWESDLIGSKRAIPSAGEVEGDSDQQFEVFKEINEDIHFGMLHWNPDKEKYYRFSFKEKFGEEREPRQYYPVIGAQVFLSVFDRDLSLLAEAAVPELKIRPQKHFFKDGCFWFFENFEDEMGFIRVFVE